MLQKHRTCFLVYFTRNRFDARKRGAAAKKRCTFETFRRGCDIVLKLDVAPPVVTVAASPQGGGDAAMRAVAVGAPRERADNALLRVHDSGRVKGRGRGGGEGRGGRGRGGGGEEGRRGGGEEEGRRRGGGEDGRMGGRNEIGR